MQRSIVYTTVDGQSFPDRRKAVAHEVSVVRVKRIAEFLSKELEVKASDKVSVEAVAAKIGDKAIDFAELVSARATRRFLAKSGGSVSVGLVGRRPRTTKAHAVA